VQQGEELTGLERFIRRAYANKKPIGSFLGFLGTVTATLALSYPKPWLMVATTVLGAASGALLAGGASQVKSDAYEAQKNDLLHERGLM
jgi:hypothetical protein